MMDQLSSALGELSVISRSSNGNMIAKVKVMLLTNETCAKWILQMLMTKNLESLLPHIQHNFDLYVQREFGLNSDEKYCVLRTVAKLIILTQLSILQRDDQRAQQLILKTGKLLRHYIQNQYLCSDYSDGIQYLLRALDISCAVDCQGDELEKEDLEAFLTDLNSYAELSINSKVAIMAVRQYILSFFCPGFEQQALEIAEEMVRLTPSNGEWHYILCLRSRALRKLSGSSARVSLKESESIAAAVACANAKFNIAIWTEYLRCLANILLERSSRKTFGVVRISALEFMTDIDLAKFIRATADDVLAIDATSEGVNKVVANIFAEVLPRKFQDKAFSKACLKRAILFHPESSDAHRELAMLYLSQGFTEKVGKRLAQAYELDKEDVNVALIYVKVMMRNMLHNYERLKEVIENTSNIFSRSVQRQDLYAEFTIVKAVYKFLCGRALETLGLLNEIFSISPPSEVLKIFEVVIQDIRRFGWEENMPGKDLLQELYKTVANFSNDGDQKIHADCLAMFKAKMEKRKAMEDALRASWAANSDVVEASNIAGRRGGSVREFDSSKQMNIDSVSSFIQPNPSMEVHHIYMTGSNWKDSGGRGVPRGRGFVDGRNSRGRSRGISEIPRERGNKGRGSNHHDGRRNSYDDSFDSRGSAQVYEFDDGRSSRADDFRNSESLPDCSIDEQRSSRGREVRNRGRGKSRPGSMRGRYCGARRAGGRGSISRTEIAQ